MSRAMRSRATHFTETKLSRERAFRILKSAQGGARPVTRCQSHFLGLPLVSIFHHVEEDAIADGDGKVLQTRTDVDGDAELARGVRVDGDQRAPRQECRDPAAHRLHRVPFAARGLRQRPERVMPTSLTALT